MVKKKTFLSKNKKNCFVPQTAGEGERDYVVRVETQSHDADLGTTDEANGLRDVKL